MKKFLFLLAATLIFCCSANAQFSGFGKKLIDKGKNKIEQKAEQKANRAIDSAIDKADDKASKEADKAIDKAKKKTKKKGKDKDKDQHLVDSESNVDTAEGELDDNFGIEEELDEEAQKADLERRRAEARKKYGLDGDYIPDSYKEAFDKVEAALATLEAAVASGNDQYVWEDPAGNDAKRALNECLEIRNFNKEDKHFVDYKQRYFNCKEQAAENARLLVDKPIGLVHMDRSQSKDTRLNDFYKLMNWYITKADAAPYARQKEYIIANASKDWRDFEKERLMLFNNTTLTNLRKKLDSYRTTIPSDKSARISNKNAVSDPVDLYLLFFSITDYSDNDYSNDANVSEGHKQSMREAEELHAQYAKEKADVPGLQSITISPGGAITSKYGTFKINSLNQLYDSRDQLIGRIERYGNGYIVYGGPNMGNHGTMYREKDGTWETSYFGQEGGKIETDGTVWFMGQKITKVDLSQIPPEWVCIVYFYKLLES